MRRVWYFLAAAVTFYIAGMFRQLPILLLFLAEMALAVVLFIQSRIRAFRLEGRFSVKSMTVQKEENCRCGLHIQSRAVLPVSVSALVQIPWYGGSKKKVLLPLQGKDQHLFFRLVPERCGLLEVRLLQLCPQDSLGLFHGHCKCGDCLQIAVIPQPSRLHLSVRPSGEAVLREEKEMPLHAQGDPARDVRQLHEYRPGDLVRYVHWKQSARSDTLLIKEFEGEQAPSVTVFLDFSGARVPSEEGMQRFYTVLDALVRGLLAVNRQTVLLWLREGRKISCFIRKEADIREMFWRLFQSPPETAGTESLQADMRLTGDGQWYGGGQLLWKFSESEYEREIETRDFSVL